MAKMFIAGESVGSNSGQTYNVINPATGEIVDSAPKGTESDAGAAIDAAHAAFQSWSETSAESRAQLILKGIEAVKKELNDLAVLLTMEQGTPVGDSQREIEHFPHGMNFYAGLASKIRGSYVPLPDNKMYGMVLKQPVGVTSAIVPWNFPITLMGTKVGPALAAGCTVVVKPASTTPLTTLRVIELLNQAGLPKGVLNVVTGPGGIVGEEILRNPKVSRVAFTGESMDKDTRVGPMQSKAQRDEIESQVADTVKRGAKVVFGGKRPDGAEFEKGFFYLPTVLADAPHDSRVVTEETFGPVLPVFKVKDLDEGIELANSSQWGLGSSVWTRDLAKARRAAERLQAGNVCINSLHIGSDEMPFGGAKC